MQNLALERAEVHREQPRDEKTAGSGEDRSPLLIGIMGITVQWKCGYKNPSLRTTLPSIANGSSAEGTPLPLLLVLPASDGQPKPKRFFSNLCRARCRGCSRCCAQNDPEHTVVAEVEGHLDVFPE